MTRARKQGAKQVDPNWREIQQIVQKRAREENQRSGPVLTPDGPGVVLGLDMRTNTNGGPGTRQWRVQLADGRIRHYGAPQLVETGTIHK